jgi:hypothetical protein
MLAKILIAWCLVATTVMFHAAALGIMLNPVLRLTGQLETRFLPVTWLVVRITWWLIVIHLVEIALWALFFWWQKCLPDAESSFYFSGATYATIGYGDLVLPKEWRLFGPVEGLTGILMHVEHEYFRMGAWTYLAAWDVIEQESSAAVKSKVELLPWIGLWAKSWGKSLINLLAASFGSWTTALLIEGRRPPTGCVTGGPT